MMITAFVFNFNRVNTIGICDYIANINQSARAVILGVTLNIDNRSRDRLTGHTIKDLSC